MRTICEMQADDGGFAHVLTMTFPSAWNSEPNTPAPLGKHNIRVNSVHPDERYF